MASESRRNQALCDLFLGDIDKHLLLKTEHNPTKMQHGEPSSLSGSLAKWDEDLLIGAWRRQKQVHLGEASHRMGDDFP